MFVLTEFLWPAQTLVITDFSAPHPIATSLSVNIKKVQALCLLVGGSRGVCLW